MTLTAMACPAQSEAESHHADAARTELQASSYVSLRHVCCCISEGRVMLCGTVPSFYLKQIAQCLLLRRLGTEFQIDNRLNVVSRTTEPCG